MHRISKLASFAVVTLFLFSCGQRGPLYLPEQAPTNETEPEATEQAVITPSTASSTAPSGKLSSTEGEQ